MKTLKVMGTDRGSHNYSNDDFKNVLDHIRICKNGNIKKIAGKFTFGGEPKSYIGEINQDFDYVNHVKVMKESRFNVYVECDSVFDGGIVGIDEIFIEVIS